MSVDILLNAVGLALCSVAFGRVAFVTASRHSHMFVRWLGLMAVMAFLALDELFNLHRIVRILSKVLKPTSSSSLNFLLLATVGLAIFIALYGRFLAQLPLRTSALLIAGMATYFAGLVGGKIFDVALRIMKMPPTGGDSSNSIRLIVSFTGEAVILYSLLDYLRKHRAFVLNIPEE